MRNENNAKTKGRTYFHSSRQRQSAIITEFAANDKTKYGHIAITVPQSYLGTNFQTEIIHNLWTKLHLGSGLSTVG